LKVATEAVGPGGKLRLAVLISGRGSNLLAIADACRSGRLAARIVLVLSDRAEAAGLAAAAGRGLTTLAIERSGFEQREAFEAALASAIDRSGAELVVLAGFMRILSPAFARCYAGRLVNIHPSLLPKYKGLDTHRRALEAGERQHGASVHFVTGELDGGPVICQARVAVRAGDTPQRLAARVLAREHRLYARAIALIAAGRVRLDGERVLLDGAAMTAPLLEEDPDIHEASDHDRPPSDRRH
jgi:phosphoribosylglycinamide formyltransferase-1